MVHCVSQPPLFYPDEFKFLADHILSYLNIAQDEITADNYKVVYCLNCPNWNENDYSCFHFSCWRARGVVGCSDGTSFVNWVHKSLNSLGTSVTDGCSKGVWKDPHTLAVIWPPSSLPTGVPHYVPNENLNRTTRVYTVQA